MKKPNALLVVLLLLAAVIGIWIGNAPNSSLTENQTESTKNHADRNRRDLAGPGESPEARARRLSPPGWEPPAVFATKGTPTPPIAFPRGENATRRYHTPQTIDLDPSLDSRPPSILAQSPADGRFHLLPDEIDAHTRLARRMVFDPSALDAIVQQNTSRLLAPTIGDEVLTLELKKVRSRDANTHTLSGHIVGEESTSGVQLVYHDGILQGNVVRYTAAQEIEYRIMADGHMMVRELDQSTMTADCGNGPSTEAEAIIKDLSEQGISIQPGMESGTVEGDTVGWRQLDVVVGYDAAARVAQGGYPQIEALIISSIDQMTLAFANSLIANSEAVLLATIEDPVYVYPGGTSGDMGSADELGDLENRTDGLLDTVSGYATQLGADFVSFVLKDADGSAGIAYRPGRSSVVARTYMSSTRITFAHELGHNLGCDHSWGDSAQSYNAHYGWRLDLDGLSTTTNDRVRTIMAYDWSWGYGARIPYYANPNVSYNGAPTGAPNGHDVRTDTKGDQRYLQNGLSYTNGVFGFDGTQSALGANNANTVNTGAGTSSYGLTYASNRATRTAFNVTSPATGAPWARGTTRTVFFTGGDEDDVATIQLYKGGVFQTDLATNRNVATGRGFPWSIPMAQAIGTDYMIRVSMTRNGSTITADSGTFSIIDASPMVIAQTPASSPIISTPVSQIVLTFSMTMDPASFTVADDVVSFTGPGAINLQPSINSAVWSSGNTVLTLGFPSQSASGSYQLVLGPQILSSTGVPMNQDQDTTTGESTQDRYTASFSVFTLAEALDTTDLTWTTSGNANWFGQTTTTQDGADAAQSGDITDSQTSSVQTTLTGPGTLTYYWKVSSENNYDWLQFFINDVLQTGAAVRISGEVAWTQVSVPIASGAQTVRWTYQKDTSISGGSDTAWLDRVVYTPAATVTVTLSYNGNGNTGGTAPVDPSSPYSSGSTVTVLGAGTLTKTGYSLAGWNTSSDGSGTTYAPGATFTMPGSNVTLYAVWNQRPSANAGPDQSVVLSLSAWSPADAGPLAWYDASESTTITQVGGAVSQWADKVGTSHMIQATGTKQPVSGTTQINGLNSIAFDGVDDTLKTATNPFGASISNAMLIGVFNIGTINTGTTLFSLSSSNSARWQSHVPWSDGKLYFDCGGASGANRISGTSGFTAGQNRLLGYYCSATENLQQVWVDGTNTLSDATGHTVNTSSGIAFGYDGVSTGEFDNCRMGEVMVINGTVSAANRQKLEGYLAHKWGLAGSLPVSHPHFSSPPPPTGTYSATTTLAGSASDPESNPLTTMWSQVSGPSTAQFANAAAMNSMVTFTQAGTYILQLTVSDGFGSTSDTVTITVQSPFQSWAAANGLSGDNAASGADPDGDGWNNLQEFAFGTLPNSAVHGPLEFIINGEVTKTGSPVLRGYTPPQGSPPFQSVFGRRKNHAAAGLTYTAEFSANLTYWTPSNSGSTVLTGAGSHEIEVVAVPFPANVPLSLGGTESPPKFFRIRIATTP